MQNNIPNLFFRIPNLYILEFDSSIAKSAKISTILYHFVKKIKNIDRIAMVLLILENRN